MVILTFWTLFLSVYTGLGRCCLNCIQSSDLWCLKCSDGYLTEGICLQSCPTGYIQNDKECIQKENTIFTLKLYQEVSFSSQSISDWYTPDFSSFSSQTGKNPLPTIDRGFYFSHRSGLVSSKQFQPGLRFNLQALIKVISPGSIISSESFLLETTSENNHMTLNLPYQPNGFIIQNKFASESDEKWQSYNIEIFQSSSTEIIVKIGSLTYIIEDQEMSFPKSLWSLGGFKGFIYYIKASYYSENIILKDLPPDCGFNEFWTGENCKTCRENCQKWPWCTNSQSCSVCFNQECTCDGYGKKFLNHCPRKNIFSSITMPFISTPLFVCPTMYTLNVETCEISTSAQVTVNFHHSSVSSFPDSTSLYFNFIPDSSMFNAYYRGVYFDGSTGVLISDISFAFSPISAYMFWLYPMTSQGSIFTKQAVGLTIFSLYADSLGLNFETVLDIDSDLVTITTGFTTNAWHVILIKISYTVIDQPTYTIYLDSYQISNIGIAPIIDMLTAETYLSKDMDFKGFIYEFSYWPSLDLSPSLSTSSVVCDMPLCPTSITTSKTYADHELLFPCIVNEYYDITCHSCLNTCNTCIRGVSCSLSYDPLCSTYTDYEVCTSCKSYSSVVSSNCACNTHFALQSSTETCCNAYCSSCDSDPVFCTTCSAGSISGYCLEACPTLYISSGGGLCNEDDTDMKIVWNFEVTGNYIYDTSTDPIMSIINPSNPTPTLYPDLTASDPVPGKTRGLYFNLHQLKTESNLLMSPNHYWILWFNPTVIKTSYLLYKSFSGFMVSNELYYVRTKYTLIKGNTLQVDCAITYASNLWFMLYISMTVTTGKYVDLKCSINGGTSSGLISSVDNYFADILEQLSITQNDFVGWIYELKYYANPIVVANEINTLGGPISTTGLLSICDKGYYLDSLNVCTTCDPSCEVCINNADCVICQNIICLKCYDYISDVDCEKCIDGEYFDVVDNACMNCIGNCEKCSDFGINFCSSCASGMFMSLEGLCLPKCPYGFAEISGSCVNSNGIGQLLKFRFVEVANIVYDKISNVPIYMGNSPSYYPNYDSNDPYILPQRGLYFTGTSYAILASTSSSPIYLTLGNTHTFDVWLAAEYLSPTSTVFSLATTTNSKCFSVQMISNTGSYLFSIEYNLASTSILSESLTLSESLSSFQGFSLFYLSWNRLTITFQYSSSASTISLYINKALQSTLSVPNSAFYENFDSILTLGNYLSSDYYKGSIYTFDLYITTFTFETSIPSCSCSSCTHESDCLSICSISEWGEDTCSLCLSECNFGCYRAENCHIHPDNLCESFTSILYEMCDNCVTNAVHGTSCQCIANSEFIESTRNCECISGYELIGGVCVVACPEGYELIDGLCVVVCPDGYELNDGVCSVCNRWVQDEDIELYYMSSYMDIIIQFKISIENSDLNCNIFKDETLSKFGSGVTCAYTQQLKQLKISLPQNTEFTYGEIFIKSQILIRSSIECGYPPNEIILNLLIPENAPIPTSIIEAPLAIQKSCMDLYANGFKSTGSLKRALKYYWLIFSDPENPSLQTYSQTSLPTIFIPSSILKGSIITLSLKVTNFFGKSHTSTINIQVLTDKNIFYMNCDKTISKIIDPYKKFTYYMHSTGCEDFIYKNIYWNITDIKENSTLVDEDSLSIAQKSLALFVIPPKTFEEHSSVVIISNMAEKNFESEVSCELEAEFLVRPPIIELNFANGSYYKDNTEPIVAQIDKEFKENAVYECLWKCLKGAKNCDSIIDNKLNNTINLKSSQLIIDETYILTITVWKNTNGKTISNSKVLNLQIISQKIKSLVINDFITEYQPTIINKGDPLVLNAQQLSDIDINYKWSCLSPNVKFLSPVNYQTLSIDTSNFIPGQTYHFNLKIVYPTTIASYSYEIYTNLPPSQGYLHIQPSTGTEFITIFRLDANEFIDEDNNYPLLYSFGFYDINNNIYLLNFRNHSSIFYTNLPSSLSQTRAFVRVYDNLYAYNDFEAFVQVNVYNNLNSQDLVYKVNQTIHSISFDPQTAPLNIAQLTYYVLNADKHFGNDFIASNDTIIQVAFNVCIDILEIMMEQLEIYDGQDVKIISQSFKSITENPNLQNHENFKRILETMSWLFELYDMREGMDVETAQNFIDSILAIVPMNYEYLENEAAMIDVMFTVLGTIQKGLIHNMGPNEVQTIKSYNSTISIHSVLYKNMQNYTISSSDSSSGSISFSDTNSISSSPSSLFYITLSTIPHKSSINFIQNTDIFQPKFVDVTVYNRSSLSPIYMSTLELGILITIPYYNITPITDPICTFIDTSTNEWSTEGCELISLYKESAVCECSHLTSFTIVDFFISGKKTAESSNIQNVYDGSLLKSINGKNALGLYICLGFFVLYIGLALYIRRKMKKKLQDTEESNSVRSFQNYHLPSLQSIKSIDKEDENFNQLPNPCTSEAFNETNRKSTKIDGAPESINSAKYEEPRLARKKTFKEMLILSHELFRLIYNPIPYETRFISLTLLYCKFILQMFFIGLFYQRNYSANGGNSSNTFDKFIKSYTWRDLWIIIYSGVISFVVIECLTYLIRLSKKIEVEGFKAKKKYSFRRVLGCVITIGLLLFCNWSIIMFSIKFSGATRGFWMAGVVAGGIVEVFLTSTIKEAGFAATRKVIGKIFRKSS